MRYLDELGNKHTFALAAALLLVALTATRAAPPDGTGNAGLADLAADHGEAVGVARQDVPTAAVALPSGKVPQKAGFVDAYISGRAPIGAIVDLATHGGAGEAGPLGGVAGVPIGCTCDLDCADGDPCTDNACDPTTNLCLAPTPAPSGTLCGGPDFCAQNTCDGGGICGAPTADPCDVAGGETCNETTDQCDNCADPADCTANTNAALCLTGDCVAGRCRGVSDCTDDEYCDIDVGGVCTLDTNGRCCADIEACAPTTLAACDDGGGAGSGNYAHLMPFDDCTCPKYSSGINDNAGADLIWQLSATEQPCTLFNRVGDDYTIANGSYLLLERFRFIGGIDADGTGDGTVVFEFYDGSTTPPLLVFSAAVGFDPIADRGNNFWQISLTTPTPIPPVGYFVMRPGTGSNETVNLLSANAVGMAGMNNPDLLWVNDGPSAFLSPDDPDIMAYELVGTKTTEPLGGCCDPAGIVPCADTTEWVCDDLGYNWVEGVLCASDPCSTGACCLPDGTCVIDSPGPCATAGGVFDGPGTSCDPNCCTQPETGGDLCSDAFVHQIIVPAVGSPAVVTTITGDATDASNGTCLDGTGGGSGLPCTIPSPINPCPAGETCVADNGECADFANDPLWWESFHIDAGANVTIDYCCTDQGEGANGAKEVIYIVITDGCDPATGSCGSSIFNTGPGAACGDGNPSILFNELTAGTYYVPIYADRHCSGSTVNCIDDAGCPAGETCVSGAAPYQMHLTVEPLPLGACCTISDGVTQGYCVGGIQEGQACPPASCVGGTCVMEMAPVCIPFLDRPTCNALGGTYIDNTTCTGAPCDLGSCCLEAGVCQDDDGVGMTYDDCVNILGGDYFGGVRCIADDPCPICAINDAAHCQLNDADLIVISDRMLGSRWADDFKPASSGPINRVCWWPCWFNPNVPEECSDAGDKPPDDFIIRFYADAGGIPGVEIGIPGGEALTPDATSPIPDNRCWNYSAPVTTPPIVNAGECYWVEITGHGDQATGCTVFWATSTMGNDYALHDFDGEFTGDDIVTPVGEEAVDLAFCVDAGLVPGSCDHTAACCLPDLTCQDNMMFADCMAAGGVFKPGEVCGPDTCPIPCDNDDCVDAFDLNTHGECPGGVLPCSFDFTNAFCEVRPSLVNCQITPGGPIESSEFGSNKWYTWTPLLSGPVRVTMCDQAAYDALLAVYDGGADCSACPTNEANTLVCGDDTCGVGGGPPQVEFDAVAGNCYFLSIGGWNGEQGSGGVTLEGTCPCCPFIPESPRPDARFGIDELGADTAVSCTTTDDCLVGINAASEVECIAGTCYVRENKYVSVDPNPANAGWLTARRVSLDLGGGQTHILGWMGTPVEKAVAGPESSPQLLSRIVDDPVYLDWNTLGSVHLGDCEISPGNTYIIEAIAEECEIHDPTNYSDALILSTVANFGDVTGSTVRQPPDTNRNFKDINAVVRGFQSVQKEPKVWLDLQGLLATPEIPDFTDISFTDINHAVAGFQGGSYPFEAPCECPGQVCP